MPDVLEFNPNRGLGFDSNRDLGFDSGRKLGFDPGRDRGFEPGRDLGFGKRGPVFRGYVCPICGAQVTADQPSCTECGAVFDRKGSTSPPKGQPGPAAHQTYAPPSPAAPRPAATPPPRRTPPPPPDRAYPLPPKRVESKFCIFCGARLTSDDTFCWQCGNRAGGG